jgi:hypothetical protein
MTTSLQNVVVCKRFRSNWKNEYKGRAKTNDGAASEQ